MSQLFCKRNLHSDWKWYLPSDPLTATDWVWWNTTFILSVTVETQCYLKQHSALWLSVGAWFGASLPWTQTAHSFLLLYKYEQFVPIMVCLFTFAWFTGHDSQEAQQADLVHGQAGVGPRRVQAAPGTALLSGHPSHQHHVTPLVLALLQPAHPGWK